MKASTNKQLLAGAAVAGILTANYHERDAARTTYLSWLSRCEANLRDRPTPKAAPNPDKPTTAFVRKRLLDQI